MNHGNCIFERVLGLVLLFSAVGGLFVTTTVMAQDNVAPSQMPPNNLSAEFVPQFVTLGFDDNNEANGIEWTLQTLAKYTNHGGVGNDANFDGYPVRASFFPTCAQAQANPAILTSWQQIYWQGHEVGNHTHDHGWGQNFDVDTWQAQMAACLTTLAKAGIDQDDVKGFRAPFVLYNDATFTAMEASGLSYDVSIQEGLQPLQNASNMYWPYTLDGGSPGSAYAWWAPKINAHPGIWSLPLHVLQVIPDELTAHYGLDYSLINKLKTDKIPAFDFNLYSSDQWMFALTKDEALAVFKYNLDARIAGNRAPLTLGFHTDYLRNQPVDNMVNTTFEERRAVVAEFLAYAVSMPQVRVVRHIDVINWMQNPTKLVVCNGIGWDTQTNYHVGNRVTFQGRLWTAKWWNRLEMPLQRSWSAWQDEGPCA